MSEVVYTSHVQVERIKGSLRRVHIPSETQPFYFSTHSEVAQYYKQQPGSYEPHATTLDYVIASAGG